MKLIRYSIILHRQFTASPTIGENKQRKLDYELWANDEKEAKEKAQKDFEKHYAHNSILENIEISEIERSHGYEIR